MANLDSLFTAWLEGESLTDEQIALLQANAEYALMMNNAMQWQQQSKGYENGASTKLGQRIKYAESAKS